MRPSVAGMSTSELAALVQGRRADLVETLHMGSIVVCDSTGHVLSELGDGQLLTYLRSSAKYIQLLPLVLRGLHREYGLSLADLAVMAASHSGEPMHTSRVKDLLARMGLREGQLRCGPHAPLHELSRARMLVDGLSPQPIHNNCSGKHTGMLAVCKAEGWSQEDYTEREHPLQREILGLLCEIGELDPGSLIYGRDGCSVVTFGLPVQAVATVFARLMSPERLSKTTGDAVKVVSQAAMAHPEMVGGNGRFDTALMQAGNGRILAKIGADGTYAVGVTPNERYPKGLGICIKIADGDSSWKIRPIVALEVLRQLGVLTGKEPDLAAFSQRVLLNCRGMEIGCLGPIFELPAP